MKEILKLLQILADFRVRKLGHTLDMRDRQFWYIINISRLK